MDTQYVYFISYKSMLFYIMCLSVISCYGYYSMGSRIQLDNYNLHDSLEIRIHQEEQINFNSGNLNLSIFF